jgi:hypothetical protein
MQPDFKAIRVVIREFAAHSHTKVIGQHFDVKVLPYVNNAMVSRAGLEPATHWLKASCSTD